MNETCDRCGPAVRAVYRVDGGGELYLCAHCTSQLSAALSAQGWAIWPIGSGDALVPQASWPCSARQSTGRMRFEAHRAGLEHLHPWPLASNRIMGTTKDLRPCLAREPASGHLQRVPAAIIKHWAERGRGEEHLRTLGLPPSADEHRRVLAVLAFLNSQ